MLSLEMLTAHWKLSNTPISWFKISFINILNLILGIYNLGGIKFLSI